MPKPETLTLRVKVEMDDKPLAGLAQSVGQFQAVFEKVEHELEAQAADIAYLLDITKTIRAELREMRRPKAVTPTDEA